MKKKLSLTHFFANRTDAKRLLDATFQISLSTILHSNTKRQINTEAFSQWIKKGNKQALLQASFFLCCLPWIVLEREIHREREREREREWVRWRNSEKTWRILKCQITLLPLFSVAVW